MKFDRKLLHEEMLKASTEGLRDRTAMAFNRGVYGGLLRASSVVGRQAATAFDFVFRRADDADKSIAALSARLDKIEQRLSAQQKALAAVQRKP